MYCKNCGYEVKNNAKFCTSCGQPISIKKKTITNNIGIPLELITLASLPTIWTFIQIFFYEMRLNGALGGAMIIFILPLMVTFFILVIQKIRNNTYPNFLKHTFIGSAILFLVMILAMHPNKIRNMDYKQITELSIDATPSVVTEYKKACDEGNMAACSNLGVLYGVGISVEKDESIATNLYRKACVGGNSSACTMLASDYEEGIVLKQDKRLAKELYKKTCLAGDIPGCIGWIF